LGWSFSWTRNLYQRNIQVHIQHAKVGEEKQPYEKYGEDHAFLADNLNPENTFEVTEI